MEQVQVDILPDNSEIIHYDITNIPLYIKKGLLSYYPGKRAVCHWHNDIEIIRIISGEMNYYINGQILYLQKGDALFINAGIMHYGYSHDDSDCEFICILFPQKLLSSSSELFQNCISPLFVSSNIPYIKLNPGQHDSTIDLILKMYETNELHNDFFEFDIISLIYSFIASILKLSKNYIKSEPIITSNEILALRKMVMYIHENYKNPITLNDISASANICKSKCCGLFQSQIHMTPFNFLNYYRLEKSAELLKTTDIPITTIALNCGFNNSSYFSKMFLRLYHCAPREYRKNFSSI